MLDSVCRNILHLIQVNRKKEAVFTKVPLASFEFSHSFPPLLLQH
jgi:hypothetical protein